MGLTIKYIFLTTTPGWPREAWPPTFLRNTNKKGKQEKKKVPKQKLLKGCHRRQNVTVLVMFTVLF